MTLVKGEYLHPTHGLAKCSVSHEEQMSPLAILVFSEYHLEIELIKSPPENIYLKPAWPHS